MRCRESVISAKEGICFFARPENFMNFPEFAAITEIFSVKELARTLFREYLIG